jgi:hypothetical protein
MNTTEEYLALAREARAAAARTHLPHDRARLLQQHDYWLICALKAGTRATQTG